MDHINKFFSIILFLVIFLLIASAACITKTESNPAEVQGQKVFKVWALADIQPVDQSDRDSFVDAIKDMDTVSNDVDMAIVAGDIASRPGNEIYNWYNLAKKSSHIRNWHEILGNHDLKDDDGKQFIDMVNKETDYTAQYGNILFIFMSDSKKGKPTEINDDTFEWWKEIVKNNQDKILVVVTHAPLNGSSIPFSSLEDRQILDSERFMDTLIKYKVDLWLSGHLHIPQEFTNTVVTNKKIPETTFIHISSIRSELMGLKNSESRFLIFYCDTSKVKILSRDHDSRNWHYDMEKDLKLRHTVKCSEK